MRKSLFDRVTATALAICMALSLVTVAPISASAAGATTTPKLLEATALEPTDKATEPVTAGTENAFTITWEKGKVQALKEKVVDDKGKETTEWVTFPDGYVAKQRFSFDSAGATSSKTSDLTKRNISFAVGGPAVVKVWWVSGGDDRGIAIYDKDTKPVPRSIITGAKNEAFVSSIPIDDAGTYRLTSYGGNIYFNKILVIPIVDATVHTVEAADLTPGTSFPDPVKADNGYLPSP